MAERIDSFRDIASQYDVVCATSGACCTTASMPSRTPARPWRKPRQGLTVVLITNSPRPHPGVVVQIRGLGVPEAPMTGSSPPATSPAR